MDERRPQPFGNTPSSVMLLGGCLTLSSSIAADPAPFSVSWRVEGSVTCSKAQWKMFTCGRHQARKLQKKSAGNDFAAQSTLAAKQYALPLKKYLALPAREGGTTAPKEWTGWADGRDLGSSALVFGFLFLLVLLLTATTKCFLPWGLQAPFRCGSL